MRTMLISAVTFVLGAGLGYGVRGAPAVPAGSQASAASTAVPTSGLSRASEAQSPAAVPVAHVDTVAPAPQAPSLPRTDVAAVEITTSKPSAPVPKQPAAKSSAPRGLDDLGADELAAEAKKVKGELDEALAKQRKLEAQHSEFTITGQVKDRDEDSVLVWGYALAKSGDNSVFGVNLQEVSILVQNPTYAAPTGTLYSGDHFLLGKRHGQNALGAAVPVWIYGDLPKEVLAAQEASASKQKQYDELQRRMSAKAGASVEVPSARPSDPSRAPATP